MNPYPLGVVASLGGPEASRPLVFKPALSCRALEQKGRLFNHVIILDQYAFDSAQVALGWIRLNEKAILSSGLFERVESLRYRGGQMRDVMMDSSLNEGIVDGPSVGVLLALSFMQLVTNCRFKPKLAVTGQLSLAGKVNLVGDVDAKLDPCTRRWADSVLIPLDNKAEADALPAVGRSRRVHYAAVRDMQDVLKSILVLPNGSPALTLPPPPDLAVLRKCCTGVS